jgi:predicted transcriptional regulator
MAEPKIPFKSGLKTVQEDTSKTGLDDALKGLGITKEDILANLPKTGTKTDTPAKPKVTETKYPSISSPTQATTLINKVFQDVLKRPATAEEMKKWKPLLKAAQEKNAATQSYKRKGTTGIQATVGGLDEQTWLLLQLSNDPDYTDELAKVKFTDPYLFQRQQEKDLYNQAIEAAAGDTTKLAEVEASTAYGRGLKDLKDAIETARLSAGAELNEDEVTAIAQEAYDKGFDRERNSLNSFLDKKFKFGAEATKGKAGEQITDLQKVAAANGLDLQKAFGTELPNWLASINKGESIDTYKKMIRSVAKIGMPQNIGALLDNGVDLDTIYSPYKNIMASVLEINPETITVNDPVLRSAITGEKELPIYEFQRKLRQDARWQYTNQAKEEVSDVALKVLKDFGFQG